MSGVVAERTAGAVFGRRLRCEVPFAAPLAAAGTLPPGAPDLVVARRGPLADAGIDWAADGVARRLGADIRLGHRGDDVVLRCDGGRVDFVLAAGRDRIDACAAAEMPDWLIELRCRGPVMAMWLELAGTITFHASAVAVGERAVAFLASGRGGKSTLAAAHLAAGGALLADDLAAVEETESGGWRVLAAYPFVRLLPADAVRWTGASPAAVERLPRAHPRFPRRVVPVGATASGDVSFGRFRTAPAPLAALVLPERRAGAPASEDAARLDRVSPAEAVALLAGLSAAPRLAAAAGLTAHRLGRLARLAETVPVWRLVHPAGHARLPAAVDLVTRALA